MYEGVYPRLSQLSAVVRPALPSGYGGENGKSLSIVDFNTFKARIIFGKRYILIPAEDGMEVNGLAVHLGNNISYKTDFLLAFPEEISCNVLI